MAESFSVKLSEFLNTVAEADHGTVPCNDAAAQARSGMPDGIIQLRTQEGCDAFLGYQEKQNIAEVLHRTRFSYSNPFSWNIAGGSPWNAITKTDAHYLGFLDHIDGDDDGLVHVDFARLYVVSNAPELRDHFLAYLQEEIATALLLRDNCPAGEGCDMGLKGLRESREETEDMAP